jgi:hypothetical protein
MAKSLARFRALTAIEAGYSSWSEMLRALRAVREIVGPPPTLLRSFAGPHAEAVALRRARPRRDPTRAAKVAAHFQRRWGTSIENDALALAASVVPAQRRRQWAADRMRLAKAVPLAVQLARKLEGASEGVDAGAEGRNVRPPSTHSFSEALLRARLRAVLRDINGCVEKTDAVLVAKMLKRPWWTEQRNRCAAAVWRWCRARRPKQQGSLWDDIAQTLWFHGWDIDGPPWRKAGERLKSAHSGQRHARRRQSPPRGTPPRTPTIRVTGTGPQ